MNAVEKINQELKGMSEKLQRCPFCWSAVNIVFHSQYAVVECKNYECAATTRKIFVKPDAEHEEMESAELKLAEIWNRRAPLYSPVKPEDVTPGWYWAVSQSGVVTVCEAMGHSLFFIRKESMIFSEYSVKTILDRGYTLYRIPELEVSE